MTATTRRALFGAGIAIAAAGGTVAIAEAKPPLSEAQKKLAAFAESFRGEDGLIVAQWVIEAGYDYDDIEGISVHGVRPGETRRIVIYCTDGWCFDASGRRGRQGRVG